MLRILLSATLGLFLLCGNVHADVVRLGSKSFDSDFNDDDSDPGNVIGHTIMIDVPNVCGVNKLSIGVTGEHIRIYDVIVSYRNDRVTRSTVQVNRVVRAGANSAWYTLPNNGLCIRRVTVHGEQVGFNRTAVITAYGSD
jgi:hypothetical protein